MTDMKSLSQLFKSIIYIYYLKVAYFCAKKKINKHAKKHPIKVLFFVSEVAKWKSQSLYDALCSDPQFEPIICIYPMQVDINRVPTIVKEFQKDKYIFFENKNMTVVDIWDADHKQLNTDILKEPSIIFYQQPWDQPPAPSPIRIALSHLTFYVPYFVINNFDKELELCLSLHKQVYRYIVQSEKIVDFLYSQVSSSFFAGKLIGLGHPCTDGLSVTRTDYKYSVIYAPHYSIFVEAKNRVCNYSTFLSNGDIILDYARNHPSVKWVFKPHPRLRSELVNTGAWSIEQIDDYYKSWEEIGEVCLTSDYQEIFVNSDLMITDCGSFLSEYSCTKKPLIRMVSQYITQEPHPSLKALYRTFYTAFNNEELLKLMNMLIEEKKDPNKDRREEEVNSIELCLSDVGIRIKDYLHQIIND